MIDVLPCAAKRAVSSLTTGGNHMNGPTPSDLIWDALLPLLHPLERVDMLMDVCAGYLPICAALAMAVAAVTLAGCVLFSRDAGKSPRADLIPSSQMPSLG